MIGISRWDRLDFKRKGSPPLTPSFTRCRSRSQWNTVQNPRETASKLGTFLASHIVSSGISDKGICSVQALAVPSVRRQRYGSLSYPRKAARREPCAWSAIGDSHHPVCQGQTQKLFKWLKCCAMLITPISEYAIFFFPYCFCFIVFVSLTPNFQIRTVR